MQNNFQVLVFTSRISTPRLGAGNGRLNILLSTALYTLREQTHYKSNSFVRSLPLLRAIQCGDLLDKRNYEQLNLYLNHGSQHPWRAKSLSAQPQWSRFEYARKQQLSTFNPQPLLLAGEATSSGDILQNSPRGRSQARSQRSSSPLSSSSRRSSPARSLIRHSSQNLLQLAQAEVQTQVIDTTREYAIQLKHRHAEADIAES
ncbi:hypothetical protein K432DRAFT_438984 [Lepidopterella palustris CBS 459.81]|uniref:Uncharacterized protein n=1 Tax=Lepidopterella palustris CBS 459.81 TaxID=1314670 RepID=A0A8E2EKQ3_9PEZI|nr:hypothetical protein K432DRAFT_438984 [Lepidopterella palustris CBS 459.81]